MDRWHSSTITKSNVSMGMRSLYTTGRGSWTRLVASLDGAECLARAGRHLDQGPEVVLGERLLHVLDRPYLHRPQLRDVQRRERFQLRSHLGVELDEAVQFFWAMEGEDVPAAGV